jgi:hypothetical protein
MAVTMAPEAVQTLWLAYPDARAYLMTITHDGP